MKKVLDRLMARQQKLMSQLSEPPAKTVTRQRARLDPAAEQTLRAAEQQAIETAEEYLAEGNLEAADGILTPHGDSARFVRTLTLLSRIRSTQGHYEEARALLLQAEAIDPADPKVAHFMADLLQLRGQHQEAIHYRRRLAYATADGSAAALTKLIVTIAKASGGNRRPPVSEVRNALERLKQTTDAAPSHRIEAAHALFAFPQLRDEARALLVGAIPCPDSHLDVEARWLTLVQWGARSGDVSHLISESGMPGRRPRLVELSNVVVHPGFQWLPTLDDNRVLISGIAASRIKLRGEDPNSPLLLTDDQRALLRVPKMVHRVTRPALLVGGIGAYYHDVVEYIGSLAIAESLGMAADLPLVVPQDLAPHQRELLALLGYCGDRLLTLPTDKPLYFERLLFPSRLAAGGRWFDPLLPAWYRRRLGADMPVARDRKLYLTRAGTARRRVVNEDEVIARFANHGYECVAPETLSVKEQIGLFAQASHIAGPAGAAMTNMIFAPPGACLTMLYNRHVAQGGGDLYFDALAKACGHTARMVECTAVRTQSGQRSIDSDLRAEIGQLDEALNSEPHR